MGINLAGVIFANVGEMNLPELTSKRTMASVPFGGKYRMIDFPLSNMSNSGINNVAVIARNHFHSLMDHVGTGKAWDLSKRRSGLTILSPYRGHSFRHRIEAMYHLHGYFEQLKEEYILLTTSHCVANIDYNQMFDEHLATGADITLMYKEMAIPAKANDPMVINTDETGKITEIFINPETRDVCKFSPGAIIIKKDLLLSLVRECMSTNAMDFRKNLIQDNLRKLDMRAYEFKGYMSLVYSLSDYYGENMRIMDKAIRGEVFDPQRPIYTKVRDDAPCRYGLTSHVRNSLVAQGCFIDGDIENSVISKGVVVEKGAVIKNCVIMQDCTISEGAHLEFVIIDKDATITKNRILSGCETYPMYIAKESKV